LCILRDAGRGKGSGKTGGKTVGEGCGQGKEGRDRKARRAGKGELREGKGSRNLAPMHRQSFLKVGAYDRFFARTRTVHVHVETVQLAFDSNV